jgi:hypothetical protein
METSRAIDVTNLDLAHRLALEDVIGVPLQAHQRLIIRVTETQPKESPATPRAAQSLDDWTKLYDGLTDEQIEAIDRDVKTRANLSRNLP